MISTWHLVSGLKVTKQSFTLPYFAKVSSRYSKTTMQLYDKCCQRVELTGTLIL